MTLKISTVILLLIALSCFLKTSAQVISVLKKRKDLLQMQMKDSDYRMIEIHQLSPTVVYELRYATTHNFTSRQLYKTGTNTYLRLPAAHAISRVQQALEAKGYGLKIFDAYRPYRVTKKMWDLIHDERYVADPSKGSGHNRGLAVDVTIIDLQTGKELNMGTGFDNFTDSAHQDFKNLPPDVLQNRELLKQTMKLYGFTPLETEWWHYSWPNDKNYDVLDLSFKQLQLSAY